MLLINMTYLKINYYLSGDIELNPGPVQNTNSVTRLQSNVVLEQRLRHDQLRPFDVGGYGGCFF